jgi:hypothetical protein
MRSVQLSERVGQTAPHLVRHKLDGPRVNLGSLFRGDGHLESIEDHHAAGQVNDRWPVEVWQRTNTPRPDLQPVPDASRHTVPRLHGRSLF